MRCGLCAAGEHRHDWIPLSGGIKNNKCAYVIIQSTEQGEEVIIPCSCEVR